MVHKIKLETEDDSAVILVNGVEVVIMLRDIGISVDYYYSYFGEEPDEPFKSDQIWFDDLE